jgi:hypothetical protein
VSSESERPALRAIPGGAGEPPTRRFRPGALLIGGGLGLVVCSVLLEHARALGGEAMADLALGALIACSIVVIVGAVRRYASALAAWAVAGGVHAVANAVGLVYFHIALFPRLPYVVSRKELLGQQGKVLVGFVLVVGVVCMIGSAIRKAVK